MTFRRNRNTWCLFPHISCAVNWVVFFFDCGALSFCWCLRGGYGLPTRPQWEPMRVQVVGNLPTRVVLLRRCLRGYSPGSFSPPVRWGLLDFMWVVFSSASSSSPLRPPTAMMWAQCPLPDLNRDHVSTVFLAGPQPRSCEFSVPCRTSTAIMCSSVCLGRC